MKVWMKVTDDELELPIAVANSAKELAQILGIEKQTIYAAISRFRSGERGYCPYRVVEIEEEDDDEQS